MSRTSEKSLSCLFFRDWEYFYAGTFSIVINYYDLVQKSAASGLVVRVPAYRFRGSGSIHGSARFSEK
jgi:hypothetical protein